jgi:quercetin dioxygenase-like cupin family protein
VRLRSRSTEEEPVTTTVDLQDATKELLASLREQPSGRAARTLSPGAHAPLKQTLLALAAGRSLQDHRAPGQATIQVLVGQVRLTVGGNDQAVAAGQWAPIPDETHGVTADEESVALLTVAARTVPGEDAGS